MTEKKDEIEEEKEEFMSINSEALYFDYEVSESIRARYAFVDRPVNGLSNVIIDSFFPRLLYKYKCNTEMLQNEECRRLPKTAVAISPLVANTLQVKQMNVDQLCLILGYDAKSLKRLFNKVKSKSYSIVFIGAGGTNVNTMHWLTEIAKYINTVNLFKKVYVFDNDYVEMSNILRFPKDVRTVNILHTPFPNKIDVVESDARFLSKQVHVQSVSKLASIRPEAKQQYTYNIFPEEIFDVEDSWKEDTMTKVSVKKDTVIYGAPDIETRDILSNIGNFVSATHSDKECYMYLNPTQDAEIQIESYGMIQLAPFFMNQLKMAISFMEFLAQDSIDFKEIDKQLLQYSFDGVSKKRTDRVYNWQLQRSVSVLTEEESENV